MIRQRTVLAWAMILLAAQPLTPLFAQTFAGNLTGLVLDPQDAIVAGADVILTNTTTGEVRRTTSNEVGRYTFSQLLPSTYNLRVAAAGFKEFVRSGINIGTDQSLEIDARLTVGNLSEAVEVTGVAPLLDTQTANRSTPLDARLTKDLPLFTRQPLHLVYATAGVVMTQTFVPTNVMDENSTRFAMNGGRENGGVVMVDGIPSKLPDWGGMVVAPGVDTVQEMQIIVNTYEAQYGRTGGGVVNIATKGGGQQYHGTAFEYLRRDTFDANSFWNNLYDRAKPPADRNQFGGNFSGPIWKSRRLYGFFGYEGLRQTDPASRLTSVPTDLQRQGDFSQTFNADGSLQTIYDPFSTRPKTGGSGFLRDPLPGNKVPQNRFDRVAVNLMKLFPAPNQAGAAPTGLLNYYKTGDTTVLSDKWEFRVDWAHTEKHTAYLRVTRVNQFSHPPTYFDPAVETGNDQDMPRYQITLGNTFIISPTMVANVMLAGAPTHEAQLPKQSTFPFASLGFPAGITSQFGYIPAPMATSTQNYTSLGNPRYLNLTRNVYNLQVNLTKERLSHSIKFGFSSEYHQLNDMDFYQPTFSFTNVATLGPDPDSRTGLTGNGLASMLLGAGSGASFTKYIAPAETEPYWAWYVQDAWKVNRRLTLNYGLRYEIQQGRTERWNRGNYFDSNVTNPVGAQVGMPGLKGGLVFLSDSQRGWWNTPRRNFAPRAGLAYKITEKLVLRTGYGIFFTKASTAGPMSGIQGYSVATPWVTSLDGGRTVANVLSNPWPDGLLQPSGSSLGLLTQVGQSASSYQKNRPVPYVQQYSFQLQSEISKNMSFELGYAGSQGRKLLYGFGFQMNQLPDAALALGPALLDSVPNPFYGVITSGSLAGKTVQRGQLLRPYPQFTGVSLTDMPGASSSFNAITGKLTRQFSNGLTLIGTYQFSKAIDNCSEDISWAYGDGARNYNNMRLNRSISGHDVPHSLAVMYIYELPVGKGRLLGQSWSRAVDTILGGWRVTGMYTFGSGLPTRFSAPDNTYSFGGSQVPNASDRHKIGIDNPTRQRWFNTAAFSAPAAYTFGTVPRFLTEVRTARMNSMNMAVVKEIKLTEKVRAQVRGEAFNAFNRNRFARPDASLASPTFGQVTSSINQPRWIQFGFRVEF